jgi:catechol 2,3-dioxygenase-like lactoylglutathione lyase family enzyme
VASRVIAVTIDCRDVERCAAFWAAALGERITHRWKDAHGVQYVEVGLPGGPLLLFQPVPEAKSVKNRLHLDVAPASGSQADEVDRLVGLGATVLADPPEHTWVVLADPEGNEFCVLPRKE